MHNFNKKFNMNPYIRALPCGHSYHEKYINDHMVVGETNSNCIV